MSEILKQSEIDAILKAINAQPSKKNKTNKKQQFPAPLYFNDFEEQEQIKNSPKLYDFLSPEILTKDNKETYQILHDNIRFSLQDYLLNSTKEDVYFHIADQDVCSYENWLKSIPVPCRILKFKITQSDYFYFQFDPVIVELMVRKSLPPKKEISFNDMSMYELTDIDISILEKCAIKIGHIIEQEFRDLFYIEIELCDTVKDTVSIRKDFWSRERGLILTYECGIHSVNYEGLSCLFYPWPTIRNFRKIFKPTRFGYFRNKIKKPQITKFIYIDFDLICRAFKKSTLSTVEKDIQNLKFNQVEIFYNNKVLFRGEFKNNQIKITEEPDEGVIEEMEKVNVSDTLQNVEVQVSVELGRIKKSVKDILQLGEGSIVELDKLAGEPVDIFVNNVKFAKGEVVSIDEDYGVRIIEILQKQNNFTK